MPRIVALFTLALLCALPATASAHRHRDRTVDARILAINDFHGQLEPPASKVATGPDQSVDAGGIEYLATHVRDALRQRPRSSTVISAGDLIGASPLVSALFHDEPTIEAMNRLPLGLNAVGNHEFDEGATELRRMQDGGCHPTDGCQTGHRFAGARFPFLAANVRDKRTGRPFFKPYAIKRFRGIPVAFVGMTLEGTPGIVSPSGIADLRFDDEADTVNRLVPELRRRGVRAIVVVLHEGGAQNGGGFVDDCKDLQGPIVDIVKRTSRAVDAFVTGHTHQNYNCVLDGRRLTSTSAQGRVLTTLDLELSRRTRDVVATRARNRVVTRDVPKAPDMTRLLDRYLELVAPLRDRVVGSVSADLTRVQSPAGESTLGDVIADAQFDAAKPTGAVAAFMNPGGVRADLAAGDVTYGDAFTVQPFGNVVTTLTLTGAQIDTLLEQQWCDQAQPRVLAPSASVRYGWSASKPPCERVDPASITIDGKPVDPAGSYRIAVNSFLADGGDGFAVLRDGTERVGGGLDLDALTAYLGAHAPLAPPPLDRIAQTG